MGLFGFGKKNKDVIDLGERYKKQQEKAEQQATEATNTDTDSKANNTFSLFDNSSETENVDSSQFDSDTGTLHDKRKKLAKRIAEMTSKLDNLNNQIYHLQQRIEVLERKAHVGRFE